MPSAPSCALAVRMLAPPPVSPVLGMSSPQRDGPGGGRPTFLGWAAPEVVAPLVEAMAPRPDPSA